jgi:hypothetical protein
VSCPSTDLKIGAGWAAQARAACAMHANLQKSILLLRSTLCFDFWTKVAPTCWHFLRALLTYDKICCDRCTPSASRADGLLLVVLVAPCDESPQLAGG